MSTLSQFPREIVDRLPEALPFDELWRVRSVNRLWNKIALHRARSLLYEKSEVNTFISITADATTSTSLPMRRVWTSVSTLRLTPQETPNELPTDLLIWGKKPSQPHRFRRSVEDAVTNAVAKRINFRLRGVMIRFPTTNSKFLFPCNILELVYNRHFSPIQTPDPMVVEWVMEKNEQDSENTRIADWNLYSKGFGYTDVREMSEIYMELPLWQFVALFLKLSPFSGGHTVLLRCRVY